MTTQDSEWADKMETARASFREVLASNEHEDGKAQRILTAMAFLTVAAGYIFGHVREIAEVNQIKFPAK